MKRDEQVLLRAIFEGHEFYDALTADDIVINDPWEETRPRAIAAHLEIPEKRALYIFEKWAEKGLYDYGTCADMGWLTESGEELAQGLVGVVI